MVRGYIGDEDENKYEEFENHEISDAQIVVLLLSLILGLMAGFAIFILIVVAKI